MSSSCASCPTLRRLYLRLATLTQHPHKARPGELDRLAEDLIRLERPSDSDRIRRPYLSEKGQRYPVMSTRKLREKGAQEVSLDLRSVQVTLSSEDSGASATRRSRYIRHASRSV